MISKALSYLLATICLLVILTGGALVQIQKAKIDFTSLDAWAGGLALVVLITWVWSRKVSPVASDFQNLVQKTIQKGTWKAGACILAITLGVLWVAHVLKHFNFSTHAFDMSFVHPVLYQAFSVPALKCDLCLNGTLLAEHMSFSMYVLAPFAKLFQWAPFRDLWVFALESLLLGGGVWLLVRAVFPKEPGYAVLAILLAISHRAFRTAGIWDLREDHLIFFFFCWGIAALLRGQITWMVVAFLLAMISKENVAFMMPFVLIPVVYARESGGNYGERRMIALALLLAAIGWAFVEVKILFPTFNPQATGATQMSARLGGLGETPAQVVEMFIFSPIQSLSILLPKIFRPAALKYMVLLVGPWLLLGRKAWIWLIPVIPVVGMNVISSADTQVSQQFHYDLPLLPFLFMAGFLGLRRLGPIALPIAVFAVIGISGRWPMHELRQHTAGLQWAKDSIYLANLDPAVMTASDLLVMPHLSQIKNLRTLNHADPLNRPDFQTRQASDNSRLKDRSSLGAERFVLDMQSNWQKVFLEELKKTGSSVEVSPSGRFAVVSNSWKF